MSEWALKTRKWITRLALIWLTRLIRLFSLVVPYWPGVRAGGVLGFVAYYLLPRERNRAIAHLTLAFPEKDRTWIRHTAIRCFTHLGKGLLEIMLVTPRRIDQIVEFQGDEALHNAVGMGEGA